MTQRLKALRGAMLMLTLVGSVAHAQMPIYQWKFDETGTNAPPTIATGGGGVLGLYDNTGAGADRHGAGGSGASRTPADRSFNNAPGSIAGGLGGGAATPSDMNVGTLNELSASFWFNLTAANAGFPRMFVLGPSGVGDVGQTTNSFGLMLSGNNIRVATLGSETDISLPTLATNRWHFLAVTYNSTSGTGQVFYGSELAAVQARGTFTRTGNHALGANARLILGNRTTDRSRSFAGRVDSVNIYDDSSFSTSFWESQRQISGYGAPFCPPTIIEDNDGLTAFTDNAGASSSVGPFFVPATGNNQRKVLAPGGFTSALRVGIPRPSALLTNLTNNSTIQWDFQTFTAENTNAGGFINNFVVIQTDAPGGGFDVLDGSATFVGSASSSASGVYSYNYRVGDPNGFPALQSFAAGNGTFAAIFIIQQTGGAGNPSRVNYDNFRLLGSVCPPPPPPTCPPSLVFSDFDPSNVWSGNNGATTQVGAFFGAGVSNNQLKVTAPAGFTSALSSFVPRDSALLTNLICQDFISWDVRAKDCEVGSGTFLNNFFVVQTDATGIGFGVVSNSALGIGTGDFAGTYSVNIKANDARVLPALIAYRDGAGTFMNIFVVQQSDAQSIVNYDNFRLTPTQQTGTPPGDFLCASGTTGGATTSGDTTGADTTGGATTAGDTTGAGGTTSGDTTGADTTAGATTAADTTATGGTTGDTTGADTTAGATTAGDTTATGGTTGDTTGADTTAGATTAGDTTGGATTGADTGTGTGGVTGGTGGTGATGGATGGGTNAFVNLSWPIEIKRPKAGKAIKFKADKAGLGTVKGKITTDLPKKTEGVIVEVALVQAASTNMGTNMMGTNGMGTNVTDTNAVDDGIDWVLATKVGKANKKGVITFKAKKFEADEDLVSGESVTILVRASTNFSQASSGTQSVIFSIK